MAYKRSIVCLANSRKLNGRCVAGIEISNGRLGGWIRPVSSAEKGELYGERLYSGGADPQLLDVIEIGFVRPRPTACHQEDHLIDSRQTWVRKGVVEKSLVFPVLEDVQNGLWYDGESTTYGLNDKIPVEIAEALPNSLKLIQPKSMRLTLQIEGAGFGNPRRKVRGQFTFGGTPYVLAVTDSAIEREFKKAAEGTERIVEDPILCISVSEEFEKQRACYKLIAGVL